jgi:hypothetical protein
MRSSADIGSIPGIATRLMVRVMPGQKKRPSPKGRHGEGFSYLDHYNAQSLLSSTPSLFANSCVGSTSPLKFTGKQTSAVTLLTNTTRIKP